ncbi:MAG: signal recognition particle protein [Candidatus Altiarchaeales archaeon]|nr:MAG: signal recognition particle protein [Candidatus Altiarchaeales archaeon]
MVFEKLRSGLQGAMNQLRKAIVVDKKTIKEYTKEIQKTLLSADVNVKLVFELSKNIEERGLLEKPPGALDRKENLIRITYEELVRLLGTGERLPIKDGEKVLLVGTQGSGKTTTAAKVARYLKKKGMNPKLLCADTFRPAAYDQLKQLSEEIQVPFYGDPAEKDSLKIIKKGLEKFKSGVIIIDSEGRHSLDKELMGDINRIYREIKPEKTLLILDSTIGQLAGEQAKSFKDACNVDGIILTKMDGSAKGGGALSACASTGAPVYFIGVGEHIDEFEEFDPERFVSRLIGFGDIQGLLERAKEVEFDEEVAERIISGRFTLEDLYLEIEQMKKLGSLKKIMDMLPFGIKIPSNMLDIQEEKLRIFRVIMDSMTDEEMKNPEIIKRSRVERIAKGSGRKREEVRELLSHYKRMKKVMKTMGDERKLKRLMRRFGGIGI